MHLYLIGYRGTGKTTVGQLLARDLARPAVDLDARIETGAGCSIREIFASEGESGFRDRESAILNEVATETPSVVATGGGIILREANRDLLRRTGFVVWLQAPAEVIWERIRADSSTSARRPNLTATGGLAEVRALQDVRTPLYHATAHCAIDATRSPEAVAADIFLAWQSLKNSRSSSGPSSSSPSVSGSGASSMCSSPDSPSKKA
jgi:shikimate kinase